MVTAKTKQQWLQTTKLKNKKPLAHLFFSSKLESHPTQYTMTTTTATIPEEVAILKNLLNAGPGFASFTYKSKSDNSIARYTLNLGFKYISLLEKSIQELQKKMDLKEFLGDELLAANEVMASLQKSLEAHKNGTQSDDYTRKGLMTSLGNGVSINHDNSIQIFGLVQSKKIISEGTPKKETKSKPMTILKNRIKKDLPISKFREFALDKGAMQVMRINGDTIEID
jgi:hypothetical protein